MKKLLAAILFTGGCLFAQIGVGITIGPPPPPRVVRVIPPSPGPDYNWIGGYWYADGGRYRWHAGYYTRPPYAGAHWVVPHHDGQRFYAGYWDGDRGRFEHDHHWDHDHNRDFREHH
jgi:WXXGXW repeat (2 copies)